MFVSRRASANEKLNTLGKELRRLRREVGITQDQLAARLQIEGWMVRQDVITRIESAKRGISDTELLLILRALKRKLSDIKVPKLELRPLDPEDRTALRGDPVASGSKQSALPKRKASRRRD